MGRGEQTVSDLMLGRRGSTSLAAPRESALLADSLTPEARREVQFVLKSPERLTRVLEEHADKISQSDRYPVIAKIIHTLAEADTQQAIRSHAASMRGWGVEVETSQVEREFIAHTLAALRRKVGAEDLDLASPVDLSLLQKDLGPLGEHMLEHLGRYQIHRNTLSRAWARGDLNPKVSGKIDQMVSASMREQVMSLYAHLGVGSKGSKRVAWSRRAGAGKATPLHISRREIPVRYRHSSNSTGVIGGMLCGVTGDRARVAEVGEMARALANDYSAKDWASDQAFRMCEKCLAASDGWQENERADFTLSGSEDIFSESEKSLSLVKEEILKGGEMYSVIIDVVCGDDFTESVVRDLESSDEDPFADYLPEGAELFTHLTQGQKRELVKFLLEDPSDLSVLASHSQAILRINMMYENTKAAA